MSGDSGIGLGPVSIANWFAIVLAEVAAVRVARQLKPLVAATLGAEWVAKEQSPPRIVIVPSEIVSAAAEKMGAGIHPGTVDDTNPKVFYLDWMGFEAYLWGDESPTPSTPRTQQDLWYSFDSTLELRRELLGALRRNCGGGSTLKIIGSRWDQPTNMNRNGRAMVVTFAIKMPLTDEPYIALPYSTTGGSGVQVAATMILTELDGSSTVAGTIIDIPPGP